MFINLHNLPPNMSMFTLYIGQSDQPMEGLEWAEEVDMVAPHQVLNPAWLIDKVIDQARDTLVKEYGPKTVVLGITNQSRGELVFDYRVGKHVPLPVVLPPRLVGAFDHPYAVLITLANEATDRPEQGDGDYRDHLLGGE